MYTRLTPVVARWWQGLPALVPHNGFYDNSIPGVRALNKFAAAPAPNIFYFTMSFDATRQLPDIALSPANVGSFPVSFPLNLAPNPGNIFGKLGAFGLSTISKLPGSASTLALAKWLIQVANDQLGQLGYYNKLPTPGPRIPRADMLPVLTLFGYGMGGYEVSNNTVPTGFASNISSADFQPNDGVVNTVSMRGPDDIHIFDAATGFPTAALSNPARMPQDVLGRYWHLGKNETMDHADQIGVFTMTQTVRLKSRQALNGLCLRFYLQYRQVEYMYMLLAAFLTRLP
jgi:hypothetical protein